MISRLMYRQMQRCLAPWARSMSSLRTDPSKLVTGLTWAKVEADPTILEFLKANFPEAFEEPTEADDVTDGLAAQETIDTTTEVTPSEPTTGDISRNIRTLTCYRRDAELEEGSRKCKSLRENRMIPGLLYGGDPRLGIFSFQRESETFIKTEWKLLQSELDRCHRSFESRVYDLTLLESPDDDSGGTVHRVVPKNVQRHPVKETIFCANFLRYHPGRPLKIPIEYANEEESSALKRGAFIVPLQRFVEVFVEDGAPIPEKIELECTGLLLKEVIRVDRLLMPKGVRFSDRVIARGDDFLIGVVTGASREEEEAAAAEEEENKEKS